MSMSLDCNKLEAVYNDAGLSLDCGECGSIHLPERQSAMSTSCPECGKQLKGSPAFCGYCGATIEKGSTDGERSSDTVLVAKKATVGSKPASHASTGSSPHPDSFGRYRVLREVGRGAMGVVYLARDDKIGRNVAIKSLHIDDRLPSSDKEEIRERLEREARAAGVLSHANIVTVYDVGEEDGVPYIAMEYLEGATLTEITADGPLSIPQATSIIEQVLSALSYAHGHDVVHRDIKPDNVFLLPDGRVKVADFGIARLASSSTMTQVGQVMGTPGYMSPEQVKGEPVGPSSDIFSTGVLFYELLTGTAAFASTSATSIMYKIVHEEPRALHLINPGVPSNLEAVIAKATAKSPTMRYASAAEMRADLESGTSPAMPAQQVSHDGTVLRAAAMSQDMPGSAYTPAPAAAAPTPKKKTAVIVGVASGAVVLAAVIVVVTILLVGSVSNSGSKKKDTSGTTSTKPSEPAASDITGYVSSVVTSSTLVPEIPGVSYVATNMIDNNPDTGWAEGVSGYGEGQTLEFMFREPVWVKDVKAIPGYKRFYLVDRYIQNGKLGQVSLTFDDGSTQTVSFSEAPDWASAGWQVIPLNPVRTQKVRVTILSAYPGRDSGRGVASDTTVSEFHFEGWQASVYDQYKKESNK
jgi:serine/threonine protein kinase